jgi:hypothetical protein
MPAQPSTTPAGRPRSSAPAAPPSRRLHPGVHGGATRGVPDDLIAALPSSFPSVAGLLALGVAGNSGRVDRDAGLVSDRPGVVPRRSRRHHPARTRTRPHRSSRCASARTGCTACEAPGSVRPRDRLHILRPPPAGLVRAATNRRLPHLNDRHRPMGSERSRLIRRVKALDAALGRRHPNHLLPVLGSCEHTPPRPCTARPDQGSVRKVRASSGGCKPAPRPRSAG